MTVERDDPGQHAAGPGDQHRDRKIISGIRKHGVLAGVILVAVITVSLLLLALYPGTGTSPQACGEKVIGYINANLVPAGTSATLVSVSEEKGVYLIKTAYQSHEIDTYATKDCTLLFNGGTALTSSPAGPAGPGPAPVISARPEVELFVMSLCPYGTQAEAAMAPVVRLLGTTADFHVRYLATVGDATSAAPVQSLHGPAEAAEDLRQACIQSHDPSLFWTYLENFDAQCYPTGQDSTALVSCGNQTARDLGIDTGDITTCARGDEGLSLLGADENQSLRENADSSPTLLINGVPYQGARTPDAYRQAICRSYAVAPPACNTTLAAPVVTGSGAACG
ncbi:hypothetical protein [Methanoregula sp.]|uniref:DsbA family protein n=1 Tax=Methanoregula sp. TaxID=2052170 RepID=UPI002D11C61A|nr:hypothetical protein [Methanoregula sp.]HVP96783.1 hypothetical protein [Methanoregula sp.]